MNLTRKKRLFLINDFEVKKIKIKNFNKKKKNKFYLNLKLKCLQMPKNERNGIFFCK